MKLSIARAGKGGNLGFTIRILGMSRQNILCSIRINYIQKSSQGHGLSAQTMLIIAVVLYDTKTILLPSFLISCQTPPKNNNNIITTIHFNFVSFFNIKVLYKFKILGQF